MSREDPKPGRWLLPLVVAGIVGFTYVFVNALPPAPAETTTTTVVAITTTLTPATTTSTTLDPAVGAFVLAADTVAEAADDLAVEAQEINDTWDAGGSFSAAVAAMEDLETRTNEFAAAVADTTVPAVTTDSWVAVIAAADDQATAGSDMLAGLKSSDQGQARLAALEEYLAAARAVQPAVNAAKTAAAG